MKVIAHRGFSYKYPEATRAAYEGALTARADGFECDVRLTKDRIPVCFHDPTTERIAGVKKRISKLSFTQLSSITEVMKLEALIDLARTQDKELLIETKHPVFSRGAVEREVIKLIKKAEVKAIPMSFSFLAVIRLKRNLSSVAYVLSKRWRFIYIPTEMVAIDIELFAKSRWVRSRVAKKRVYLWTVNEESYIPKLKEWKISGVITDRPDLPFRLS